MCLTMQAPDGGSHGEQLDPGVEFSSAWYLACYPDIGMEPLDHYIQFGRRENRLPHGYGPDGVDPVWYRERYDDLEADVDPAVHYATQGWRDGRDPNPNFSTAWYMACYPDLGMNPLVHFLVWGRAEGRLPHGRGPGAVDEKWYLARNRDLDRATNAAIHYAETGWREGRDPNPTFSTSWYLVQNPGLGMNPLIHYLQHGRSEGRSPRPGFRQTVRSADWVTWKLGPLFTIACATILKLDVTLLSAWAPLLIILAAIVPGAAYAAMINDLTDRKDDMLAGKPNAMVNRPPALIAGLLACCLVPGAVFLVLWRSHPLLFGAYLAAWAIFSAYSFPPLRLKTRGAWGVLAEASASGLFPTLVTAAVVFWWFSTASSPDWMLAIGLWSMALGVRGILGHQLLDRHADGAASVSTFVRRHGDAATWTLITISFAVEVATLVAILLMLKSLIVAAVTLAYFAVEIFVGRALHVRTVVVLPDGGAMEQFRPALHSFYQIYLPLGVLLQLSKASPVGALVTAILFLPLVLDALRRERNLLAEAVVRTYFPTQLVFDRSRRSRGNGREAWQGDGCASRALPSTSPAIPGSDRPRSCVQRIDEDSRLDAAIASGIEFLRLRQQSDGSFPVYYSLDHTFQKGCIDDVTPFGSAMVAHCLGHVAGADAQAIVDKSIALFLREMRSGVWRYWLRAHPRYKNIPPDVDTTSCISLVLREQGVAFPDNKAILLLNRTTSGLFYTWLKPRLRMTTDQTYWRMIFPQLCRPLGSFLYWRIFNTRPQDCDGLINANVLAYLGIDATTDPIVEFLCAALADGREDTCDKWYRSPLLFYYLTSRALHGVFAQRDHVRVAIAERTCAELRRGRSPLDLAFGISTLITCEAEPEVIADAVERLLTAQDRDGSWAACPMYYDGPKKVGAFGSEELTTGFCLEALARYRIGEARRARLEDEADTAIAPAHTA